MGSEPSEFDVATQVEDQGDGRFTGAITPGWDIGGNANGGYLLAIAVNAMRQSVGRADPVTVSAQYLAPGRVGAVEIETHIVKQGKRFSTVTGAMRRDGRTMLAVLAGFGDAPAAGAGDPFDHREGGPPNLPPIDRCVARSRTNGDVEVAIMDRLAVFLDPACARYQTGILGDRTLAEAGLRPGEMAGWVSFADGRPWDTLGLMLACDCFPPAVFNLDLAAGWVPTVELSVQVRARPAPGPLRCRFLTRFVRHGQFEEDGELWDSEGNLVALSRQLALLARA